MHIASFSACSDPCPHGACCFAANMHAFRTRAHGPRLERGTDLLPHCHCPPESGSYGEIHRREGTNFPFLTK